MCSSKTGRFLKKIFGIKSKLIELPQGKMSVAFWIKYQTQCRLHLGCNIKVQSVVHKELLEKKVDIVVRKERHREKAYQLPNCFPL